MGTVSLVHQLFATCSVHCCVPVLSCTFVPCQEVCILVELLPRRCVHGLVVLVVGTDDGCRWLHLQMRPLELICTLGPQQLHQEENQVGNVAFDELVDKAGSLDLVQDRINLVSLLTHVLEHVVNFTGVEHLLSDFCNFLA